MISHTQFSAESETWQRNLGSHPNFKSPQVAPLIGNLWLKIRTQYIPFYLKVLCDKYLAFSKCEFRFIQKCYYNLLIPCWRRPGISPSIQQSFIMALNVSKVSGQSSLPASVEGLSLGSDSMFNILPSWVPFMSNQYFVSHWTGRPNIVDQVYHWMHVQDKFKNHWKHNMLALSPWQSQFCVCSCRFFWGTRTVSRHAPGSRAPRWRDYS